MSQKSILFVTEDKIKSFTGIDENLNPDILYPFVIQAQDLYVQQTLGTKLYNKVKSDVEAKVQNGTPIPADYKTLLDDYIVEMVIYYTYYLALPHIKYKTSNKGVLSGNSETSDAVSLEELQFLMNKVLSSAQFYNERLRDYLKAYQELYPEYNSYTEKDGMQPDRGTSYWTGLSMPKNRYEKYCDDEHIGDENYRIY